MPQIDNTQDSEPVMATFEKGESEVRSYSRSFPVIFERASGSKIFGRNGKEYLDFLTGCSTLNYGHNPPELRKALMAYIASDGITHSLDMYSEAKERFLKQFQDVILKPRDLDYVMQFPGPTGANAVEAALKLARKVTGRTNVIAFTNAFHGVTLGALACTGNQHHRGGAGTPLQNVTRMPFDGYMGDDIDTADYLEKVLDDPSSGVDAPAAVIVETVQGEGGLNAASCDWMRKIARIARERGALFIVDDIQAGVGRTGTFFSFEPFDIKPDIVTMAKSLSGYGLPLALVLIDRKFDKWAPGEHNGTFRGNCHAFVTARVAVEEFWSDKAFEASISELSGILENRLASIAKRYGSKHMSVKGRGMMLGLDVKSGDIAAGIVAKCFEDGLIIETSGPNDEVVKCLAALTASKDELGAGLDILEEAIKSVMTNTIKAVA